MNYNINDPRETDSDFRGISIQDMGYNVLVFYQPMSLIKLFQ